jgi:hypothetical protein
MDLLGVFSNPVGPLKTMLEGTHWIRAEDPRKQLSQSSKAVRAACAGHRRRGWVLDAIVRVLAERQKPMRLKEIHAAVEALLGEPVRWASVKASLAGNISGSSPRFIRVGRGKYGLASGTREL